jgi:hypothetical protein
MIKKYLKKLIAREVKAQVEETLPSAIKAYVDKNIQEIIPVVKKIEIENVKLSDTPWINITSEKYDPEEGIFQLEMDWNDKFIEELKKAGFTAAKDEDIVRMWLASLTRVY